MKQSRDDHSDCLGEDLSEAKDQSIVRRTLKKGEGWAKPNDDASVEVHLKGTHDGKVFDERTVSFIVGEGFTQNIPEAYVLINEYLMSIHMFIFVVWNLL